MKRGTPKRRVNAITQCKNERATGVNKRVHLEISRIRGERNETVVTFHVDDVRHPRRPNAATLRFDFRAIISERAFIPASSLNFHLLRVQSGGIRKDSAKELSARLLLHTR